ncbi:MAG: response regulator [Candidatus Pacearchaeota archaeon]|jgi:DNA-binding response OmpR family regulator
MVKVVLLEDSKILREIYKFSLEDKGFSVMEIDDGKDLENVLKENNIDIILSDTHLITIDGPDAVKSAYNKSLLGNETLVIGMSDDPDSRKLWKGLAHYDCFYDKGDYPRKEMGEKVLNCWNAFNSGIPGWRMKL